MKMLNTMLKINSFKKMLFFILLFAASFIKVSALAPGDIPQPIIDAIKAGNTIELGKYFDSSIDLSIVDQEDIYSKQQAEFILKDFFAKHAPSNFVILHKGGKEGSQYAIGNLTTAKGNYRVTIWLKQREGKLYIHQLRFEEGNVE